MNRWHDGNRKRSTRDRRGAMPSQDATHTARVQSTYVLLTPHLCSLAVLLL